MVATTDEQNDAQALQRGAQHPHSALAGLTPDETYAGAERVWQLAA